jgi:hypothetical protein
MREVPEFRDVSWDGVLDCERCGNRFHYSAKVCGQPVDIHEFTAIGVPCEFCDATYTVSLTVTDEDLIPPPRS